MNVCMIAPFYLPVPAVKGGAVEQLITEFIGQNEIKKEIKLDIITINDKEALVEQKKFKYTDFINVRINDCVFMNLINRKFSKNKYLYFLYKRIRKNIYNLAIIKAAREKKYDFIITEGGDYYYYSNAYKRIAFSKSILHIHGKNQANEFLNNNFKYFISVSNFINDKLKENGIIKENRTKILYNGVDFNKFNKKLSVDEKKKLKESLNIKNSDRIILFCGRTVEEKGVKELIEAFKLIKKDNYKLIIIGNSGFADNLETEYEKNLKLSIKGYEDRIFILGHIDNKELYKYYNTSDVAVFPHKCEEAFGLTIVEAMMSEIPIITTNVGAIPEIVGDTGVIISLQEQNFIKELSKQILELIENEQRRYELCIKAKERAKQYSVEAYYDNYIKILKELENENRNINIS